MIFGFLAAWSAYYLFIFPGTNDLLTSVAILDLGVTMVAIVFIIGGVWLDL